jgi:hypothetical protein
LREWTGENKEMFKESEDKYIRIHRMDKRKWLRCEIIMREVKDKVRMDCRTKGALRNGQC